ncbi:hypothetical protein QYS62_002677 [Fusarium acuminatum]|uniref:ATP synthase F0 subunit 8 n=1 Tax=Fusarium acuminatum TaxID=5515 RepID=A0ABZ2WP15_9HYPO
MAVPPSVCIAILFLTLFAIFAVLAWWFKTQVHVFVRAIFKHRQAKHQRTTSTVATTGEDV